MADVERKFHAAVGVIQNLPSDGNYLTCKACSCLLHRTFPATVIFPLSKHAAVSVIKNFPAMVIFSLAKHPAVSVIQKVSSDSNFSTCEARSCQCHTEPSQEETPNCFQKMLLGIVSPTFNKTIKQNHLFL